MPARPRSNGQHDLNMQWMGGITLFLILSSIAGIAFQSYCKGELCTDERMKTEDI